MKRAKRSQIFSFFEQNGAYVLAALAAMIYVAQAWSFAHTQISVLDEGAYLMKGLLFATGRYQPFQDYGPLTNHMPLAFLIPGWVQVIFGPGLATGRYFAIALGLLMLLGLWLLVRRLRGPWWAAAAVAVFALNPALIKMYSVGVSQVLVSCMLVWGLCFLLGTKRELWQLAAACALAALVWFTRINMAPVLLLFLFFIYWEYGWRVALQCAAVGFGILLVGHLLYWPGVLKLWAYWLPESITPFLNAWRLPPDSLARWSPTIGVDGRINSLLQAFRFNLVPVLGLVAGIVLWKRSIWKKSRNQARTLIFLALLFLVLFAFHAAASLVGNYCVYCFQVYLGFFDVVAVIFVVLAAAYWTEKNPKWINVLTVALILMIGFAMGYAASDSLAADWLHPRVIRNLLAVELGGNQIWVLAQNKFGMEYDQIANATRRLLHDWLPAIGGLLIAGTALLAVWWTQRPPKGKAKRKNAIGFAVMAWLSVLALALLLSPTPALGAGYTQYDCNSDVIASHEDAGEALREYLEPGKMIYWLGGESAAPLLYVPGIEIFPTQLNDGYTFRLGGDPDVHDRLSYWDDTLRTRWLDQADYMLIEASYYDDFWVNTGEWIHLGETSPVETCRESSSIQILGRPSD